MSDTKPYQAAAEALYLEQIEIMRKRTSSDVLMIEAIRSAIEREVDEERKCIQVDLHGLGQAWGEGTAGYLHYCSAAERIGSRIGSHER